MKTIIVPTDFSKNAFIAAQYASSLAKAKGYNVLLYHVYIVLYSGFGEKGGSVKHIEWADEEAGKGMSQLLETLREQYPEVDVQGETVRGFLMDSLTTKLKNSPDIAWIVMGTKGATNVTENVFGSTTYEVLKKAPLPVLVVPSNTPDFSLAKVGFFSAYSEHESKALQATFDLLSEDSTLDVIHFLTEETSKEEVKSTAWHDKIKEQFPDRALNERRVSVEKADLNAVNSAVQDLKLDLLVFTRPNKSFFSKIFEKSLTKAVINYPVVPSLFFKE